MISRQHIDGIKIKPVEDERQFTNFKIQKHDLSRTCDFSKLKGKSLDFKLHHINGTLKYIQICTMKAKKGMIIAFTKIQLLKPK